MTIRKKKLIFYSMILLFIGGVLGSCTTKKAKEKIDVVTLIGEWKSEQGTLFTFDEDGNYGYYKDESDREDNFYKGTYTYQSGKEAMNELGITTSEFETLEQSEDIKQKDIFAVKMKFEILFSEGIDKSDNLNKEDYYYFAFYLLPEDKAIAVNMSTFDKIELNRIK